MRYLQLACLLATLALASTGLAGSATNTSFPVAIIVDAGKSLGELKPFWRMFGADKPNYATMSDGRKLIGALGALKPKDVFFRTHNLLCSGDGAISLDDMKKSGVRGKPDVSALASLDGKKLAVFVWHYHDDDVSGPDAAVELTLAGLHANSGKATLKCYTIDADHSNFYQVWKLVGSPLQLPPEQLAQLEKAGQLAELGATETVRVENGKVMVGLKLPRQAVALPVLNLD